jgi:hypothetical protein
VDTDPIGRLEARHPPIDLFDDYKGRHIRPKVIAKHRAPAEPRQATGRSAALLGTAAFLAGAVTSGIMLTDGRRGNPAEAAPYAAPGNAGTPWFDDTVKHPIAPRKAAPHAAVRVPVAVTAPLPEVTPTVVRVPGIAAQVRVYPLATRALTPTVTPTRTPALENAATTCPTTVAPDDEDTKSPEALPEASPTVSPEPRHTRRADPPEDLPRNPRADEVANGPKAAEVTENQEPTPSTSTPTSPTATEANTPMISSTPAAPN